MRRTATSRGLGDLADSWLWAIRECTARHGQPITEQKQTGLYCSVTSLGSTLLLS